MPGLGKDYREKKLEDSMAASGSDQQIMIRGLGETIAVSVAGKKFEVAPGSFRFHGLLKRWCAQQNEKNQALYMEMESKNRGLAQSYESWRKKYDIIETFEKKISAINKKRSENLLATDAEFDEDEACLLNYQTKIANTKATITPEESHQAAVYSRILMGGLTTIVLDTNEYAVRTVQLILLNSKDRDWRKKYLDKLTTEGFPTQELLDSVISYDDLFDDANLQELNNVFEAFKQLNKPELLRKNALALAGMQ